MGHQHAWWPAVSLLAAVLLLAAGTCGAGEIRLGARLGGGFYGHDDVNDMIGYVDRTVNDIIDGIDGGYGDWRFTSDDLKGSFLFAANGEYLLNENWCLGAEFMPLSSDGGYDLQLLYEDAYGSEEARLGSDLEATGNLLSAYVVYRLPMGSGPLAWRFGGGIDYVFGAKLSYDFSGVIEDEDWSTRGDRPETYFSTNRASFEASGSAVGFHGRAGAEYQVADHFLLVADASLRFLKIDELEVGDVSFRTVGDPEMWPDLDVEEGGTLRWVEGGTWLYPFSTDEGKKIGLDFSGLYLTVGAFYTF